MKKKYQQLETCCISSPCRYSCCCCLCRFDALSTPKKYISVIKIHKINKKHTSGSRRDTSRATVAVAAAVVIMVVVVDVVVM